MLYEGFLGSLKSYFPNGMVVVSDAMSKGVLPDYVGRGPQVLAGEDILLCPILQPVDGLASVKVWTGPRTVDEPLIHDGSIKIDSGRLQVGTVGDDEMLVINTRPGTHQIQIFGEGQEFGTPDMTILLGPVK